MLTDIFRALHFAAERHKDQRRKGPSAEPYINHLLEVAFLLSGTGKELDHEILIAGILHDIIEDTATSPHEVSENFGPRVGQLVQALSDDKALPRAKRKLLVLEHLPHAEDAVKLIKLADLCSNVGVIPADWAPERVMVYLAWARQAADCCAGVSTALDNLFLSRWTAAAKLPGVSPRPPAGMHVTTTPGDDAGRMPEN